MLWLSELDSDPARAERLQRGVPRGGRAGSAGSGLTGRDTDVELTDTRREAGRGGRALAGRAAGRAAARGGDHIAVPAGARDLADRRRGVRARVPGAGHRRPAGRPAARRPGDDDPRGDRRALPGRGGPPRGGRASTGTGRPAASRSPTSRCGWGRSWPTSTVTTPAQRVVVVAHDAVVLMMRAVIEQPDWDEVVEVVGRRQRPERVDHPLRRRGRRRLGAGHATTRVDHLAGRPLDRRPAHRPTRPARGRPRPRVTARRRSSARCRPRLRISSTTSASPSIRRRSSGIRRYSASTRSLAVPWTVATGSPAGGR